MKREDQSNLQYLLSSRPLIIKRNGRHLCLHDAFSGEVLAGQAGLKVVEKAGDVTRLVVEFVCDGQYVRMAGD